MTTSGVGSPLDKRVHDLLAKGHALAPADKKAVAAELHVPEKAVEAAFAKGLAALERASVQNEGVAVTTQKLRSGVGDGVGTMFAGQKSANISMSPALLGKNLSAPGDNERAWKKLTHKLDTIVAEARVGVLSGKDLDSAIAALPKMSDDASAFLWTPAGAQSRHAVEKAYRELAAAAPNAVVTVVNGEPYSARMESLVLSTTEAQFTGDTKAAAAFAHELATDFPASQMAPWARQVAGMTADVPVRDATWADAQMKEGAYALPSGTSLEVAGKELLVSVPPGTDTAALVAQGFTFFGDTGKLIPPSTGSAYVPGSYALPGGGTLNVGAGNDVAVAAPKGADWSKALSALGFRESNGAFDVPRAASSYWPSWKPADVDIGDGVKMHLAKNSASFDVTPYDASELKKSGFSVSADGRTVTPPLDKNGAIVAGTYELPNHAKLVVGKDNAISLDISRLVDSEYDKAGPALEKAGFVKDGNVYRPPG